MRSWILALVAAFGLVFGSLPSARADSAPCPTCTQTAQAGDALSIFLAMLQGAPPGAFTYQEAKSLGPTAFEITGISFAPEGPGSAMPIARLSPARSAPTLPARTGASGTTSSDGSTPCASTRSGPLTPSNERGSSYSSPTLRMIGRVRPNASRAARAARHE